MNKVIIIFCVVCFVITANAQPAVQQRIEDSVIGWQTVYNFKGRQYKPLVEEKQTFSPYQQSFRDSFIVWVQRTYTPIGGWGTVFEKEYTTIQRRGPVPQGIGADFLIWNMAFDATGKKLEKISETWTPIRIYTNHLSGINRIETLSYAGKQYYFTMPRRNYNSTFTDPDYLKYVKDYGLHDDDRFKKYMVYFDGIQVNVVLIPGNQLPIKHLNKGEFLQALEDAIPLLTAKEKADRSHNKFELARIEPEFLPRWLKSIAHLKDKYKNRLNEPAYVYQQYAPTSGDLYSGEDFFIEGRPQYGEGFAVYEYDKAVLEKSRQDKPLWITISWQPQKPGAHVKQYEIHRAMLRFFNFEYVYDYFFNPEEVKGIVYSSINAEEQKALLQGLKKHYAATETKPLPQGVHFADDFSGNDNGDRPKGWSDSKARPAKVVVLKDKPGKWVQLAHMNELSAATSLKKPLPENFSLDFDIITGEFNDRDGGGVLVKLSSYPTNADGKPNTGAKGTEVNWEIKAGNEADYNNNNYRGRAIPRVRSSVAGHEGDFQYTYSLREFTNKKTFAHATLKAKNGQVSFFINGKPIGTALDFKQQYCKDCVYKGIPSGTLFSYLSFTNTTYNWSADRTSNEVPVYISNIKITKE
ncbi:MAG TPA: hypothetical protein PLR74_00575 [Agriterribacter sp.]|nr:hypothetical protein [Agriterribacter sp.]